MKDAAKRFKGARGAAKAHTERSVQRGLRWSESLDTRVEAAATKKGFRSPQEFIISIVIEKLEAEAA